MYKLRKRQQKITSEKLSGKNEEKRQWFCFSYECDVWYKAVVVVVYSNCMQSKDGGWNVKEKEVHKTNE